MSQVSVEGEREKERERGNHSQSLSLSRFYIKRGIRLIVCVMVAEPCCTKSATLTGQYDLVCRVTGLQHPPNFLIMRPITEEESVPCSASLDPRFHPPSDTFHRLQRLKFYTSGTTTIGRNSSRRRGPMHRDKLSCKRGSKPSDNFNGN